MITENEIRNQLAIAESLADYSTMKHPTSTSNFNEKNKLRAYKKYLKHIGVDKDIKEYLAKKVRTDVLSDRITAIFNEIKKSVKTDDRWDNSEPHMYTNISESDIEKGFKWCCNKTAQKQETETAAGKMIADLENRKRAAVDQLHGINELQELTLAVNGILNGAGVPLLGE